MSDVRSNPNGGPLELVALSSPGTAALLHDIELVLIPVGAHEQHGPNCAVSTDTVSAEALCQAETPPAKVTCESGPHECGVLEILFGGVARRVREMLHLWSERDSR